MRNSHLSTRPCASLKTPGAGGARGRNEKVTSYQKRIMFLPTKEDLVRGTLLSAITAKWEFRPSSGVCRSCITGSQFGLRVSLEKRLLVFNLDRGLLVSLSTLMKSLINSVVI